MSTHLEKVIETASRVTGLAEDALRSLDVTIAGWPAEFRAIMWETVADIATQRAAAAKKKR